MGMFGNNRKRNNNNGLMMSLVGLGVGAAAYNMVRNRNQRNGGGNDMMKPIKQAMDQMRDPS